MHSHFLLVAFPAQSHINPALQFAKRLIRLGARVTFATSLTAQRCMSKTLFPNGLSFATYDQRLRPEDDLESSIPELRRRSSQALTDIIMNCANEGKPITCLVYTLLLPWAIEVARAHHLPSALLWIQTATVFDIYYYYFNGYGDLFSESFNDSEYVIDLTGLPSFTRRDLPSFIIPSDKKTSVLKLFREQLERLIEETSPKVLVNTFDALESDALNVINEKFNMIGIGPLIPSAFLDGKDPLDKSFGCDLLQGNSKDYIEWLNSKPTLSVAYVSFGSISILSKRQMEGIAKGLLDSGLPFLWVIREEQNKNGEKEEGDDQLSAYREELEKQGMIVPWCCQVEVLSHPSIGCFVTHCGWNSTLESLVAGVPVVAFPQWTDQGTNAKLIEDMWKTGVRVVANEEGIVDGDEIKRCLDLVMEGET